MRLPFPHDPEPDRTTNGGEIENTHPSDIWNSFGSEWSPRILPGHLAELGRSGYAVSLGLVGTSRGTPRAHADCKGSEYHGDAGRSVYSVMNGVSRPSRSQQAIGRRFDSSRWSLVVVSPVGTSFRKQAGFRTQPGSVVRSRHTGFTLIDILVSIAIIAVLIGLLLPSLAMVRSASEKVVCASNIRQAGLGLHMYAMDNGDYLPLSTFSSGNGSYWDTTPLQLRFETGSRGSDGMDSHYWDGLGVLIGQNYLSDGRIFFCPSHLGENTFERYLPQFEGADGEIIANYQYRGLGPNGEQRLDQFESSVAIVSDGFRDLDEINHANGMNVLRAGMGVNWFRDTNLTAISNAILGSAGDDGGWDNRWEILDQPVRPGGWSFFD